MGASALVGAVAARSLQQEWATFKATHGKIYSPAEEERRFNIFTENKAFIERHNALNYIMVTGYIDSEDSYPYVSGQTRTNGACTANPSNSVGGLSTCGATQKKSETDLQAAVAQVGPIGVAIDAGGIGFQLYSGGVYTSSTCSSTSINHAVLAAGYGSDSAGTPYWTVKNSWGTGWGDNGYILMRRNYGDMCAIASTPAYAIL